ncbi:hypothetical protein CLOM_g2936 [Closterium sp. NIES-68]|nr:hypothetical protein CLOM_g2936 [Closterium sp. NIES-68]GJP73418.1 hypothetical protein CLOP_g4133 [Closterium sp. NIES-67]
MTRTPCCEKAEVRKGPWTREEDELLVKAIKEHGEGNWSAIPKKAGLIRCGKSCRLRWANYLRPDLKRGAFSTEEEALIVRLHKEMGNRWAKIALELPGRTDNDIKNHWNTRIKKKLRESGIDPETHLPLATRLADGMALHAIKRPLPAVVGPAGSPYPFPPSKKQCLEPAVNPAVPACATSPPQPQAEALAQAQVPFCPSAEVISTGDVKAEFPLQAGAGAPEPVQRRVGFRSSSCSSSDEDEGDSEGPSLVDHDGEIEAGSPTSVIVSQIGARARVTTTEAAGGSGLSARGGVIKGGKGGAEEEYASLASASTVQMVRTNAMLSPSAQGSNSLSPAGAFAKLPNRSFKVPPPSLIIPCSASAEEAEFPVGVQLAPAAAAIGGAVLASPFMLRNCLWDSSDLNCPWADDLDMDTSAALPVLPSPKFIPLTPSSNAFGSFSFGNSTPSNNTNSSNYSYGYSGGSSSNYSSTNNSSNSNTAAVQFCFPTMPTPPASTAAADLTAFDHLPQPLTDSHLALHAAMDSSDCQRLGGGPSRCEGLGSAGVGSSTAAAGELVPMALVSPPLPGTVPLPSGALDGLTLEMDVKADGGMVGVDGGVEEEDVGEDVSLGMCLSPEEFDSFDLGLPPGVCPSPMPGFSNSIFSQATPAAATPAPASGF